MEIVESIVSDGHGPLDASYICIHETANPGASARQHVRYWSNDPRYAVHYVADWTGVAYHCVPDDRLCWQVGGGNRYVVGIELCHATNTVQFEDVWRVGVEWAAWALSSRGWGVDRLISHDDARRMWGGTDHTDPIDYFASYGKSWEDFVAAVAEEMETEVDYEKIAEYVLGYEIDGVSVADRLRSLPHDAALEVLGYVNEAMNGSADVYQLITDTRRLAGWDYKNPRLEGVDAYQILRDVRDGVNEVAEDVDELNQKIL